MKKTTSCVISAFLTTVIVFSALFSAPDTNGAENLKIGDVNSDGTININDVTSIQRFVAGLEIPSEDVLLRALVVGKTKLSIDDATAIQKYIAMLPCPDIIGKFVESDETQSGIPEYYNDYLSEKIGAINSALESSGENSDSFVFITDYHRQANSKNSPALIKKITEETEVSRIIFGGDAQDYEKTPEEAMEINKSFTDDFGELWDNMYCVIGNHEFNSHYGEEVKLTYEQITGLFVDCKRDSYGAYDEYGDYRLDVPECKISYFFVGSTEKSTVRAEQLNWLFSEFEKVEDGYSIIVFSHLTFKYVKNDQAKIFVQGNVNTIAKAMTALNNRTSFKFLSNGETHSFDFSQSQAEAIAVMGGHAHFDASTDYPLLSDIDGNPLNWKFVPVISTTSDAALRQKNNVGELERSVGTVSEQAFDVVIIDKDNRKIIMKRIGAGSDREFSFS